MFSSEEKKCYRLYAFKSDEKTADRVITTLKEMYFVVHKIHRAKKRKKRELERRKAETQPPEIQMPESQSEQQRPLSAYLSEHALDEHQVIFPTTFGASATHVTAELDSMIEELSMETKSLETATPQAPLNPFVTPEMSSFNFDDNFHEIMPFSEETKANNRVSFYDSFSYNSVDIVPSVEPTDSGATPTIDDEFISIAKRNVAGGSNSGSRSNSFTKLFQKERTSSYTKLESIFAPLSPEQTGTKELTVANPFSELTSPKEKIPTPNTS